MASVEHRLDRPAPRETTLRVTRAGRRITGGGADGIHTGRVVSPRFVGRAAELAAVVAALTSPPAVVVLEGEPGIGKTRLVTEVRGHPDLVGRGFLIGACRQIREPFPLGPVLEAVRALPTAGLSRLSRVAGALRPLLPELADALPPAPEPLDDRAAERHRQFRGLRELLAAAGPVTVVLEDLHWTDDHTVNFLRYALADPVDNVSWLLTFRGEETPLDLRGVAARLPETVSVTHVALRPLTAPETGQLAAAVAGLPRVPTHVEAYLQELTGGLPFAVEEVVSLLRERGAVPRRGRGWSRRILATLSVPGGVRDHVLGRVALLPERVRPLLDVVAVLAQPAPEPVVAAVAARPVGQVAADLSAAVAVGLLADDGDVVGFRHALAAQAVYEAIPGPRRRHLHARAAEVLAAGEPPPLGQIAHHLRRAGRVREWVVAAERAADRAVELGHHDEAVRLLEEVLRHTRPEPEVAGRIALTLARAACEVLRAVDVDDLLTAVLALDLPRAVRGELQLRLGILLHRSGTEPQRVRRLLHEAVGNLRDRDDLRAWAIVAREVPNAPGPSLAARRRRLHQASELAARIPDPDFSVYLLGKAGAMLALSGDPGWRALMTAVRERTAGRPRTRCQANAYYALGGAACYIGHHDDAGPMLSAALAGVRRLGDSRMETLARSALALLDFCRGRWHELDAAVTALLDQLAEVPRMAPEMEAVAGALALARGRLDEAAEHLAVVTDPATDASESEMLPMAVGTLLRLKVARGDVSAAVTDAEGYLAQRPPDLLFPAEFRALPYLVGALVAGGRPARAEAVVDGFAERAGGLDVPLAPAAVAYARGLVRLATGDPGGAVPLLTEAAERYGSTGCRYEAAQAREKAADALVAAGRPEDGAGHLRAAVTVYRDIGAVWDTGRATRTARRHRLPVPRAHRGGRPGYGAALSPRERQVAELAAAGRTNREIARDLYLSPETIKKHLQSAMRKLGVSTRLAIAERLASGADGRGQ